VLAFYGSMIRRTVRSTS